ncbi:MAG: undecaprenyl-diphosphate phosphatase [Chloroflexi bacterium]|nr:undecaprenyl-diphosphate phosphatase [Chloroflexota bacterium]
MIEDIIKVVILSLIEGVTEFLPISSTGHLVVGTSLLKFDVMDSVFEIFIQIGAVAAVIAYYRSTLLSHVKEIRNAPAARGFWLRVALGSLPAAATGFLFGRQIEALLFTPHVVAVSLILGGVVFLLVERKLSTLKLRAEEPTAISSISLRQAIVVGLVQVLALIPGVSRSGSSIVGGMLAGMNRRLATEFSFFLAIPLLGGATVYKLLASFDSLDTSQLLLLFIGAALSALFAWLAIDWLLRFIARSSFVVFGYYRIAAGLLVLAAASAGWLA